MKQKKGNAEKSKEIAEMYGFTGALREYYVLTGDTLMSELLNYKCQELHKQLIELRAFVRIKNGTTLKSYLMRSFVEGMDLAKASIDQEILERVNGNAEDKNT